MKGFCDNPTVDSIVDLFVTSEASSHSFTWICRVPSASNVADPPSRGDTRFLVKNGFEDFSPFASKALEDILLKVKLGEKGSS